MKNKTTLYQFVIDKSGSMSSCIDDTIGGFNLQLETLSTLETRYPDQRFLVSLTQFNSEVDFLISNEKVSEISTLNRKNYRPGGSTSLLDAIGLSIQRIERQLGAKIETDEASVVFVILTDGHENSSRQFRYAEIARMIQKLEDTDKWTFSFLGADIDAFTVSEYLNIRQENVIAFQKSDMRTAYNDVSYSMSDYANSKSQGITKKDLLDKIRNKDRR